VPPVSRTNPIDVVCPHCGAVPGERCFLPNRTPLRTGNHTTRNHAADQLDAARPARLDISEPKLAHKLKHRKRATGWIWCDFHCEVHTVSADVYDEGASDCKPDNWRRVYVETDNENELF
jgi:hypothetical protein